MGTGWPLRVKIKTVGTLRVLKLTDVVKWNGSKIDLLDWNEFHNTMGLGT